MAWYNKYRPDSFEKVIGQDLVKQVLINSLKNETLKHAYLLNGPKGTGKTTIARIFANSINRVSEIPEASYDIIEMDAASNTGIDDIRSLIDSSQSPPLAGKYKIYIIDEIHMLSKNAMNGLLKILEEPPSYLIFLLATTNPEKLIPTILSRVTKLNLKSHTKVDIVNNLKLIAEEEKVPISQDALEIIAKRSEGAQRDAINLLETIAGYNLESYNRDTVSNLLGLATEEFILAILGEVTNSAISTNLLTQLENCPVDGNALLNQILEYILNKSLYNSDTTFDSLVIPLSEILSLNLPINDAQLSFAIFQSKVRNLTGYTGVKVGLDKKESGNEQQIIENKKPVSNAPQIKGGENINKVQTEEGLQSNKEEVKQEKATPQISPSVSGPVTKKLISSIIKDFSSSSVFTLKLIGLDIIVEELNLEQGEITVSVSNAVYLSQLEGAKNKQAFTNEIFNKTGVHFQLIAVRRKNNLKLEVTTSYDTEVVENVNFIGQNATSSNNPTQNTQEDKLNEKAKQTNNEKGLETVLDEKSDYFYKIYKTLKPNMEGLNLEVFTGEITKPKSSSELELENKRNSSLVESDEDSQWTNNIGDFEFE